MIKLMKNNRQGSSLIMALMLMGSLISLTFGAATVFNKDLVSQRSVIDSAQAYYSAEAGVEKALSSLSQDKDYRSLSDGGEVKPTDASDDIGGNGFNSINVWSNRSLGSGFLLNGDGILKSDQSVDLTTKTLGENTKFEFATGKIEMIKLMNDINLTRQPPVLYSSSPPDVVGLANTAVVRLVARGGDVTGLKITWTDSGKVNTGTITIDSLGMSANKEVKRLLSTKITPFAHPLLDFAVYSREGID